MLRPLVLEAGLGSTPVAALVALLVLEVAPVVDLVLLPEAGMVLLPVLLMVLLMVLPVVPGLDRLAP